MTGKSRIARRLLLVGAGSLFLGLSGCSEELGPEAMPVAHVTGVVTEGGQPVSGGWIEFFPTDGTIGNLRAARIKADGSFDAPGVAVGLNLVRLVNAPLRSRDARDLFGAFTSPIRRTIPPGAAPPVAIDLVDEAILYSQTRVLPSLPAGPRTKGAP